MEKTTLIKKQYIKYLVIIILALVNGTCLAQQRPNRLALVIGDQFKDPMSYLVDIQKVEGAFSGNERAPDVYYPQDFYHTVILLKSWSIPFDIIRLDQQFLDINMFIGADDNPIYGGIIWLVNDTETLLHPDFSIIKEVVEEHGIGMIAMSNRIQQKSIEELLGIEYIGEWETRRAEMKKSDKSHYITNTLPENLKGKGYYGPPRRTQVKLSGATAIAYHGDYPLVTVREIQKGGRTVWIGGDVDRMWHNANIRKIIRNAITWVVGYTLYKTWENTAVMWIDDFGNAQNVWLEHWHYPTLSADTIEQYLIKPLLEHNAILNINLVPGFINDEKGRLEPAFQRDFVDDFGTRQNYISTKQGLDKGLELGVFSFQNHGLTHMQPDLTSEPIWYGSDLDKERAEVGWYREFGDIRRQKEIPAAEQYWRMKTAQAWTKHQFGVTPLAFNSGGPGASIVTYTNHTYRIAARAGFGWSDGYLGNDLVVHGWAFNGTEDSPYQLSAPPDRHDFGIYKNPEGFQKIFTDYPNVRFMSASEHIAYLHSSNLGIADISNKSLKFELDYDTHYCSYFSDHSSTWKLEIADWFSGIKNLKVSGAEVKNQDSNKKTVELSIPKGVGKHTIMIEF